MDWTDKAFIVVLVVALAATLFLAAGRMRIEAKSRVVEIIVDAEDVRRVAAASGKTFPDLLSELHGAGASALGVREATLEELQRGGQVSLSAKEGAPVPEASTPAFAAELAGALTRQISGDGRDRRGRPGPVRTLAAAVAVGHTSAPPFRGRRRGKGRRAAGGGPPG